MREQLREDTMIGFLLGAATGYVLGARAGRERYEQIVRTYHRVAEHPAVQSAAGVAREKVTSAMGSKLRYTRNGRVDRTTAATVPPSGTVPPSATVPGA
jgi:hypothetical protein